MQGIAECVDISATDIDGLLAFALAEKIDLTVVGPESSLVEGLVDAFEASRLRIFGPSKRAAILEGSKVFTKEFLTKYAIPTAPFKAFRKIKEARKYLETCSLPIVVKADGLAAGQGGSSSPQRSRRPGMRSTVIMKDNAFGAAGDTIIIEDCLVGEEASFLVFTDGKTIRALPTSQDHKAIFDGDKGPNTGGMGAYSPAPVVTPAMTEYVIDRILKPTVEGMAAEGRPYKGILYAGLMIDGGKINVLEFNCRFGDPEAQPLLMRIESDIVDIFEACIDGSPRAGRDSGSPAPDLVLRGDGVGRFIPAPTPPARRSRVSKKAAQLEGVEVFHAGTRRVGGKVVTSGGRVLGVTAIGANLARRSTGPTSGLERIHFPGCYFRRDIGGKALKRLAGAGNKAVVGIVMGSDSDLPVMKAAADFLDRMGVAYEMTVASPTGHRSGRPSGRKPPGSEDCGSSSPAPEWRHTWPV